MLHGFYEYIYIGNKQCTKSKHCLNISQLLNENSQNVVFTDNWYR